MKKIKLNRDFGRLLKVRVLHSVRSVPQLVLVQYQYILNVLLVMGALALLAILSLKLIVWVPEMTEVTVAPEISLRTDVVDDLEFWIEERHAVQQQGLTHIRPEVFVGPEGE